MSLDAVKAGLKEKIGEDGGDRYEPDFEVEVAEQLRSLKKKT